MNAVKIPIGNFGREVRPCAFDVGKGDPRLDQHHLACPGRKFTVKSQMLALLSPDSPGMTPSGTLR